MKQLLIDGIIATGIYGGILFVGPFLLAYIYNLIFGIKKR